MQSHAGTEIAKPEVSLSGVERNEEICYAFFILDNREFGIRVEQVHETIIHDSVFTRMPCSMDALDGLINLRGSIIPIINLRTRFQIISPPPSNENRIAITRLNGHLFGLIFDEISEVVRIKSADISSVKTAEADPELCNQGIISLDGGQRIVQLLDLERLFAKYNLPSIDNVHDDSRAVFKQRKQDISFMLDGQEYAIEVGGIREIIKPPQIRQKIQVDPAIKGVIDLRGELINIVDLRSCFNAPVQEMSPESRIIIIQGELGCGLLVDSIREVIHYDEDQLLPMPLLEEGRSDLIGIISLEEDRNIIKLNPEQLFDGHMRKQLFGNIDLHREMIESEAEQQEQGDEGCIDIAKRVLISFRLGDNYAFDIALYREIINYPTGIVALPGTPSYHEGILNLRNNAIPIINLRKYYGMTDYDNIAESRIIILNLPGKMIGIVVDDIIEIVKPDRMRVERFPGLAIDDHGAMNNHIHEGYRFQTLDGDEKSLLIYDVERLINDLEMTSESQLASSAPDRGELDLEKAIEKPDLT